MTVVIPSPNTAVERLLVVAGNRVGEVHRLEWDATRAGGKPVNVARVLADLGGAPLLAGFRGGLTGELAAAALADEGLGARWVRTAAPTRVCEVLVDLGDPGGATVYNAAGAAVGRAELSELDTVVTEALPGARALVCAGSTAPGVPDDQYARWVAAARAHDVLTVVDTTGERLLAAAEAAPAVVKLNRAELQAAAADVGGWLARGVRAVIVTDGGRDTLAATPGGYFGVTPPEVTVVSAVGSGDAFTAGLVHSVLHSGRSWSDHLRAAAACGAANATNVGAGLPGTPDLDTLRAATRVRELTATQFTRALS